MSRLPAPEPPRRDGRAGVYLALFGGILFVSGFMEAVFAHSVLLLTVFLVYLLAVSLIGALFRLWK